MSTFVQWIHVAAAVIGVGGTGFLTLILLPLAGVLYPDQRDLLLKVIQARFRWVSWCVIFLLLVSGVYNVRLAWEVPWGVYWMLLTVKIILALVVFAISLCLTLPLRACDRFRVRRQMLLSSALAVAMIVILISAYLRRA